MPADSRTLNADNLIWIDMEMTGLQPDSDRIIEIAVLVTSAQLEIIAEGPVLAVHQPDEVLAAMDSWNQSTHRKTGLVERVRASPRTVGRTPRQRTRPALPIDSRLCSVLPASPIVARQSMCTLRISPERRRSCA